MRINELEAAAVRAETSENEATENAPKLVRLDDESLEKVAGGVYCTACHPYSA